MCVCVCVQFYLYVSVQPNTPIHPTTTMLGGWANPHREQQTIPQGQTSIPRKSFSTLTANGQSAPGSGSARGVGRGAGSYTPSMASDRTVASMKRDRRKSLSAQADPAARQERARAGFALAFTRYYFTFMVLSTNQSSLHYPRPAALPTRLQYCCNAQYSTLFRPPRFHVIHHTMLCIAISCKGEGSPEPALSPDLAFTRYSFVYSGIAP